MNLELVFNADNVPETPKSLPPAEVAERFPQLDGSDDHHLIVTSGGQSKVYPFTIADGAEVQAVTDDDDEDNNDEPSDIEAIADDTGASLDDAILAMNADDAASGADAGDSRKWPDIRGGVANELLLGDLALSLDAELDDAELNDDDLNA